MSALVAYAVQALVSAAVVAGYHLLFQSGTTTGQGSGTAAATPAGTQAGPLAANHPVVARVLQEIGQDVEQEVASLLKQRLAGAANPSPSLGVVPKP